MLVELLFFVPVNVIALTILLILSIARTVRISLRLTLITTIFCLTLWQDVVFVSNHVTEHVLFLSNFVFVWPTLACLAFFSFIYQLSRHKSPDSRFVRNVTITSSCLVVGGSLVQAAALLVMQIFISGATPESLVRGPGYIVYIVGLVFTLTAVIGFLSLSVISARSKQSEFKPLFTVLITVIIATFYGLFSNVLVPLLTNSQTYASIGILTVVIIAVGFTLSILRDRLLDIKFYVVRTATYLLSLATLVIIYSFATLLLSRWILGYAVPLSQGIINVAIVATSAFIFQPIRKFFDRVTNRIFYSDTYDSDSFYAQLNRELSATNDLTALLKRTSRFIATTLKVEQVFFFVPYHVQEYTFIGTPEHTKPDKTSVDKLDAYFAAYHNDVIYVEALSDREPIKSLLNKLKIAIILPLRSTNGLMGHLYIGEHRKGKFSYRDINVLKTISDELVIAIQNARSVQEIKEFNATLQQRIQDATKELRTSNAQLQRLDEAKDEFVSMASHQLRTPLTSVKGYISMVLEGDAGKITSTQRQLLGEAFTSSERMVHLINDFLNVSRLQTGKFVIEEKATDLSKVITQEVESLRTTAKAHDLTITYRQPSHFPILYLDEGKIRQVLMNFIDNAIYYSPEGSTITVSLANEEGFAVVKVKDEGIGVPESERAHLFSKFFRASNARKQRPDGTGVGLFLAKKVIVAQGGSMVFDSKEGEGSTFGFRLPIKKLSSPSDKSD